MSSHHMRKIWQARRLVLSGHSVADIALITGMSKSTVYSYTKQERAKMKAM